MFNVYEIEVLHENMVELKEEEEEQRPQVKALSLSSYLGTDSNATTLLRGYIGTTKVIFMLDSGTTQNFVFPHVIEQAKLPPHMNPHLHVKLGTVLMVNGIGVCTTVGFHCRESISSMTSFLWTW